MQEAENFKRYMYFIDISLIGSSKIVQKYEFLKKSKFEKSVLYLQWNFLTGRHLRKFGSFERLAFKLPNLNCFQNLNTKNKGCSSEVDDVFLLLSSYFVTFG